MGHVQRRNGKFIARYRAPSGRETSKTFGRKLDATNYLAEQRIQRRDNTWIDPSVKSRTFGEQALQFQASRLHLARSTQALAESLMRNQVLPYFDGMRLADVFPTDVQAFVSHLIAQGLSPSTVRQCYLLVAGVFSSAIRDNLQYQTPCRDITLPKQPHLERRYLTAKEISSVADASGEYRLLVLAAAYTGMRWGELAGLTLGNVNFLKRTITITMAFMEVNGSFWLEAPKSSGSMRTVSVPASLIDEFAEVAAQRMLCSDDNIFTTPAGAFLRRSNFRRRVWLPAVRSTVGLPCTFHDLRHSHAALLIDQGEHPKLIQARFGHGSIRVTMDTYGHLFDGMDRAAADLLDETLASAIAGGARDGR
jgi:integrase